MPRCACGCEHRVAVWDRTETTVTIRIWGGEGFGFRERLIDLSHRDARELAASLLAHLPTPTKE